MTTEPGPVTSVLRRVQAAADATTHTATSVRTAGTELGAMLTPVADALEELLDDDGKSSRHRASDRLITPLSTGLALVALAVLAVGLTWLSLTYPWGDVLGLALRVLGELGTVVTAAAFVTNRHQLSRVEAGQRKDPA